MTVATSQPIVQPRTRSQVRASVIAALIAAAHVLLALWWGVVVPIGEGPDEPGHFDYALFVAREGRLPVQRSDPAESDVPGEGHQPPLAYWIMQPAVRWLPLDELRLEMGQNPDLVHNGGDQPNAYFRSSRDVWPYVGVARAWHLARAISALLGGITVWLIYLIGRRVWSEHPWLGLCAAAIAAFNPQFIFAHALVSNDPLLFTLTTALIYGCVRISRQQSRSDRPLIIDHWSVIIGALLGLLLITKQSALAFVPLPLLAIVLRRDRIRSRLSNAAIVMGVALLIASWWYVRNLRVYGDWFGLQAFQETFAPGGGATLAVLGATNGLWNLLRSSWGNFGWLSLPLVDGAHWAFATFLLLAIVGLVASVGSRWWSGRERIGLVLVGAALLACAWTIAFAIVAGPVAWQGRFLFPAIAAFALLIALGLGGVLPGRVALWSLIGLEFVLALALPWGLIAPAYPSFVIAPQPDELGNVYGRFDVGWKRGIELRDVQRDREAAAGDTLDLALTWHALEQMDRPWTVFVHVVDAQGTIVAERNAEPRDGLFPTDAWVRGDWVRDLKQVPLTGVPAGTYRIEIGVYDPATSQRLGVYDRNDQLFGDRIDVGSVVITEE